MAPKVSGKAVKKAGEAQKKPSDDKKKKKKRRETYSIYIYKVLQQGVEASAWFAGARSASRCSHLLTKPQARRQDLNKNAQGGEKRL